MERKSGARSFQIKELDADFFGIATWGDKTYRIRGALPSETVQACENRIAGVYDIVSVQEPSAHRVQPLCGSFLHCGGCSLQHMTYETQLSEKTRLLRQRLSGLCPQIADCVPSSPFACRNKAQVVFGEQNHRTVVGFFNEDTHKMIRVSECPMHGPWFCTLTHTLEEWAAENRLRAYDPATGKGALRFAVARHLGGGILVTVVSNVSRVSGLRGLYELLRQRFGTVSLYLNINSKRNSAVFSDHFIHITGEKKLSAQLLGVSFQLSPNSFFQVNEQVAAKLYTHILKMARDSGADTVVDAYSGIGITSLLFARAGMQVVSIEMTPQAVDDARALITQNKLEGRIRPLCGDCAAVLPRLRLSGRTLFFVDPPRRGLGAQVCRSILKFAPDSILYLSCNPQSLEGDLRRLYAGGYRVQQATPYDLFPQTPHVETIVLLQRQNS